MKIRLFNRTLTLIISLFIFLYATPVFAKETLKLPQDIQDKISATPATKASWYIRKASSSKAGKVVYGPFETKEQAIIVWQYFNIPESKAHCIAKNDSFITRTPSVFYRKEMDLLKVQVAEYGMLAVLDNLFLGISYEDSATEVLSVKETPVVENKTTKSEVVEKTPEIVEKAPEIVEKSVEIEKNPEVVEKKSEQIIKTAEEVEKNSASENKSLVKNEQSIIAKEEVKEAIIPETVIQENEPIEPIVRYKKEYLQDYAPIKTAPLPSDEEEIVEYKVENPDAADVSGRTLLMKACETGNDWEITNLIKSGANVNLKDKDGWTALMYAVRYQQNIAVVKSLINAGAQIKAKNNYGLTALLLAATYNDNPEILKQIVSKYSISEKELLQSFIQVLSSNTGSEYSTAAKVQVYIDLGLPLNVFYQGKTPLMYAASFTKSTKIIKLLLQNGAQTAIRSTEGKTAFDYAAENKALPHDEYYWALNQK